MITASVERFANVIDEVKPLLWPHWEELALDKDSVPLDPMYEVYREREAAGQVLLVVLRERGGICAYFLGFVAPGLHYRDCLTLTMDLFYLAPEFRDPDSLGSIERDLLCDQLFDAVEVEARRRGVQRVFYGSKMHKDCGALFERRGMKEVERWFSVCWRD